MKNLVGNVMLKQLGSQNMWSELSADINNFVDFPGFLHFIVLRR